ncbi:MAG: hypothetical protein WCJ56_00955 [bacterium]
MSKPSRFWSIIISVDLIVIIVLLFPLLAVGALIIFALSTRALRRLPEHEYEQAVRAPAWFAVAIGLGITALSVYALGNILDPVLIGPPQRYPILRVDSYSCWGTALLGFTLALLSWVPAARRSMVPHTILPFIIIFLLTWLAELLLFSISQPLTLWCWLLLFIGVYLFWWYICRPDWRWRDVEISLVMLLCALLGLIGLWWLMRISNAAPLPNLWQVLMNAREGASSAALLMVMLGMLGPAIYLPWWLWVRREDARMVWQPAAGILALTGVMVLVRLVCFTFPGPALLLIPNLNFDQLYLIKKLLIWLSGWGMLAVFGGALWQANLAVLQLFSKRRMTLGYLHPLALILGGMLLLGLAAGFQAQGVSEKTVNSGMDGLLWTQLGWCIALLIWLVGGGILPALALKERGERGIIIGSMVVALASICAFPLTPGYAVFRLLWATLPSPLLLVAALVITAAAVASLLPRWLEHQATPVLRPGSGWGIFPSFIGAVIIIASGIFAGPLIEIVRLALLTR